MNTDIVTRLRQTRADMIGTDDEQHYWDCHDAAEEIERLRLALARLADQNATFSVIGGNMIVDVDASLADEEQAAIRTAISECESMPTARSREAADVLRLLLERTR